MAPDRGKENARRRTDIDSAAQQFGPVNFSDNDDSTHQAIASDEESMNDFCHETSRAITHEPIGQEPDREFLGKRSEQTHFTLRALLMGLIIGVLIAFSNTYFGLQTGWISGMAMPSALIGYAYFKGLRTLLSHCEGNIGRWGWGEGFSEVENVLVQTVAGSVGTMPLGCGFVGVVPALEYLLTPEETPGFKSGDSEITTALALAEEQGGLKLPLGKLMLWALGICFFGVVFAVPLRKEVIVREKLRFPSGTATALMIGVLHGGKKTGEEGNIERYSIGRSRHFLPGGEIGRDEESQALMGDASSSVRQSTDNTDDQHLYQTHHECQHGRNCPKRNWKKQIRLLTYSFSFSGAYTLLSYFVPKLHSIPIFGQHLSTTWLWNLNPSPAYIGQGIIMGPATTIHMLIGAILGWAVLSPLAKYKGWASGDVGDWNSGSKGWIVWVSLAIMLVDAIVSLGWLILRPTIWYGRIYITNFVRNVRESGLRTYLPDLAYPPSRGYSPVNLADPPVAVSDKAEKDEDYDAPPEHLIGVRTTLIGLVLSLGFCLFAVQSSFAGIISIGLTTLALLLALLLSIMGVRALGETDLNPVSGISKLTQLIFAVVTPPNSKNAVTINLIAGAISESGALQAGDLLQDLKTGHLLGASPKAQFYGQLIGSAVGAVVSASVYKLYTRVYEIPSELFQVPTGYVWIFTARLVTGKGLPPHISEFAAVAALIWAIFTGLRIYGSSLHGRTHTYGHLWQPYIPGGIAVAVGMYNTPSFTLARSVGGLLVWWWTRSGKRQETPMIILASGLILGEGLVSIVNLGLASAQIPHL